MYYTSYYNQDEDNGNSILRERRKKNFRATCMSPAMLFKMLCIIESFLTIRILTNIILCTLWIMYMHMCIQITLISKLSIYYHHHHEYTYYNQDKDTYMVSLIDYKINTFRRTNARSNSLVTLARLD